MLDTGLVALIKLNGNAGKQVRRFEDKVDNSYKKLYQTLAYQQNVEEVIEPFLLSTLVIRHLERIADYSINIAQRLSSIVTGYQG